MASKMPYDLFIIVDGHGSFHDYSGMTNRLGGNRSCLPITCYQQVAKLFTLTKFPSRHTAFCTSLRDTSHLHINIDQPSNHQPQACTLNQNNTNQTTSQKRPPCRPHPKNPLQPNPPNSHGRLQRKTPPHPNKNEPSEDSLPASTSSRPSCCSYISTSRRHSHRATIRSFLRQQTSLA